MAWVNELKAAEKEAIAAARKAASKENPALRSLLPPVDSPPAMVTHESWEPCLTTGFFHDNIMVNLCSCCPIANRPEPLVECIESGLVLPLLTEPYTKYSNEVLGALVGRQHVGREAMAAFAQSHYCSDHKGAMCQHCIKKLYGKFRGTPETDRLWGHALAATHEVRASQSAEAMDELDKAIPRGKLSQAAAKIEPVFVVERARLVGATAYLEGVGESTELAQSLQIDCPIGLGVPKYLEVVERHRGELGEILAADNDDDLAATVSQINGEIESLRRGRGKVASAMFSPRAVSTITAVGGAVVGAAMGGLVGAACGAAIGLVQPAKMPKFTDPALAKCADVLPTSIRVWRIRGELARS